MKDFKEELKLLEDLGLGNVCLVKKYNPETEEYEPSHIIFNYWVKATPVSFKAVITSKGYDVYFKDSLLFKTATLDTIIKKLERKKIKVHLANNAQPDVVTFDEEPFYEEE